MRVVNGLLGAIAAVLAATALGAIWSLIGLAGSARASWMAIPSALVLALVLRFNKHPPGMPRAIICTLLMALTIAYANWLMAAGFIAGQMGLGLVEATYIIGLDMALAVAKAQNTSWDLICYAAALVIALVLGWLLPNEASKGKNVSKRRSIS